MEKDLVVIRYPGLLEKAQVEEVEEKAKAMLGERVDVLVLDGGASAELIPARRRWEDGARRA